MSQTSGKMANIANLRTATHGANCRNTFRLTDEVMAVAQRLWPRKTAVELSLRTGTGIRACEYWLARQTDMSAEALVALLRSDAGFAVLETIIGDTKPSWWKHFKRAVTISQIRKQQADAAKRLEQLEMNLD